MTEHSQKREPMIIGLSDGASSIILEIAIIGIGVVIDGPVLHGTID